EKRRLHLAGQNLCQTSASAFITQNADEIFLIVRGRKERQSLNVVPVSVCDQKSQLHRARSEFFVQSKTEQANPGAGIENDDLAVGAHFHATGVSAIADCALSRDRS